MLAIYMKEDSTNLYYKLQYLKPEVFERLEVQYSMIMSDVEQLKQEVASLKEQVFIVL